MTIQQMAGTTSSYAAGEQGGGNHSLTVLQGQPGAAAISSQARHWQYGDANTGFTMQSGVSGANAYVSQGAGPYMAGYYFAPTGPGTGTWVEVDRTVSGGPAQASSANMVQNYGSNLTGYILQYGSSQSAYVTQSGSDNLGGILQSGSGNSGNLNQSGALNSGTISQQGSSSVAWMTQSGSGNRATIKQR
jgi:hypothetical protein